jgi:NAD(P)-dependent dehydrogenase (short-subunit alcohol dehydrogenase family)
VEETGFDTWATMLGMNATAAFHVIRAVLPALSRPGRIVAISSIASLDPAAGMTAYTVSKAALNALIRVVADETKGSGITANALAPSTLGTDVPHANVAESIAWLLSDAAQNVSGAVVPLRR